MIAADISSGCRDASVRKKERFYDLVLFEWIFDADAPIFAVPILATRFDITAGINEEIFESGSAQNVRRFFYRPSFNDPDRIELSFWRHEIEVALGLAVLFFPRARQSLPCLCSIFLAEGFYLPRSSRSFL